MLHPLPLALLLLCYHSFVYLFVVLNQEPPLVFTIFERS